VVKLFRERSDRIATVWCVIPVDAQKIPTYYLGEGTYEDPDTAGIIIDWWSVDLFEPKYIDPSSPQFHLTEAFLRQAEKARKPVLIGESSAQDITTRQGQQSCDGWFAHFHALIRNYPGIKASIYIKRNWSMYAEAGWSDWGDCRIEVAPVVAENLRTELDSPLYLHAVASDSSKTSAGRS